MDAGVRGPPHLSTPNYFSIWVQLALTILLLSTRYAAVTAEGEGVLPERMHSQRCDLPSEPAEAAWCGWPPSTRGPQALSAPPRILPPRRPRQQAVMLSGPRPTGKTHTHEPQGRLTRDITPWHLCYFIFQIKTR